MKRLFGYIRVSTPKQGKGASLFEQRSIIEAYAQRTGAAIIAWFEERKTAARTGRPEFSRMMKLLRQGKADGVIIHKIDRSTRNYRDWADIDELIESGVNVYFANEDLDLRSRGGRLAADMQVVVAVDYIRNLREEALKGIHGRLKQGILPHHAPIGYLDCGPGKPKVIDPLRGPIVRRLFERYASGAITLRELTVEASELGLRNRNGNPLRLTQLHHMMRNPFYAGVIRSVRYGLFKGAHEPIADRGTYDRVQAVLDGKIVRRTKSYSYLFRRLMHCKTCGRSLIGSESKGRVYYRCSTITCPTTSVREDRVDESVRTLLGRIALSDEVALAIEQELREHEKSDAAVTTTRRAALTEALSVANARLSRLADLLIDGKIDPALHDERREAIFMDRHALEEQLAGLAEDAQAAIALTRRVVELAKCPAFMYETADALRKRQLLEIVLSNCIVMGKEIEFSLHEPFATLAARDGPQESRPHWYTPRTFSLERLKTLVEEYGTPKMADALQRFLEPEEAQEDDAA